MTSSALGDTAIVLAVADSVSPETVRRAQAVAAAIERQRLPAVTDVVPAFASVAVYYEPARLSGFEGLRRQLEQIAQAALAISEPGEARRIEIPVAYGGEFGPDLEDVARHCGFAANDVVERHAAAEYVVNAIGFVPGFPYLGGLPASLATPRRPQPRASVPSGAVGIGGSQTGVYPFSTPGGWNLIGQTPLRLFDPARPQPALLRTGDRVRFRRIEAAAFAELAAAASDNSIPPAPVETPLGACEVTRAGLYTTLQDLGRPGFRAAGVVQGGAADPFALRVANLLVGNLPDAAALEFTLEGPDLSFDVETIVALAGAEVDGFPAWQARRVAAGEVLKLGRLRRGCRGYLAIGGGIQVSETLGSRSTYERAGFGGWQGRALRAGDRLPLAPNGAGIVHGRIDPHILPRYRERARVRVVLPETSGALATELLSREFVVSSQSDRMGLRLAGPALTTPTRGDLGSAPVTPGTIQVPPDGRPIVLLRDAQTIGGYEPVAHAITVDLPVLAQLRPGDRVHFVEVSLAEAHDLAVRNERALGLLAEGLAGRRC